MSKLTDQQLNQLVETLRKRFEQHPLRHPKYTWAEIETRLLQEPDKLHSLYQMEQTGGEPDVVALDNTPPGQYSFVDCTAESPKGRRSLCYDQAALHARKENKPASSVEEQARAMGATLLDEVQYRQLQAFGAFDTKTSSWVQTPEAIRALGGALFCDRRYNHVFTYHNGAESYYAARGFRCLLMV